MRAWFVAGNAGNLVVFRIGAKDAAILGREFTPTFSAENLVSIPHCRAYVRMMIDDAPATPFSAWVMAESALFRLIGGCS